MDPNHRHALVVEPGSLMERVYGEGKFASTACTTWPSTKWPPASPSRPAVRTAWSRPSRAPWRIGSLSARSSIPKRLGFGPGPADLRGVPGGHYRRGHRDWRWPTRRSLLLVLCPRCALYGVRPDRCRLVGPRHALHGDAAIDELILTGRGQHNGMLFGRNRRPALRNRSEIWLVSLDREVGQRVRALLGLRFP